MADLPGRQGRLFRDLEARQSSHSANRPDTGHVIVGENPVAEAFWHVNAVEPGMG